MQRAPKIRLISLAGTAVFAVVVPLAAATAGPADTVGRAEGALADNKSEKSAQKAENGRSGRLGHRGASEVTSRGPLAALGLPLLTDDGRTSRCGPELASPRGIEAQTCVLAERGLTWARTYYRNPTGAPLRAVLTLLRPDGRTVQVHCNVPAADRPGVCETPTGATVRRARVTYGAVAEIADAAGERMLLRAAGNSAPEEGGSDLLGGDRRES